MAHGHLLYFPLLQPYQGGQESVHPGEHRDPLRHVCVEDLQRTTGVDGIVAGHEATEGVGYSTLYLLETAILAVGTDTHHQFIFVGVGEQQVEVFGRCLQVGIDISHQGGLGGIDTRFDGGTQSTVLLK